MNRCQMLKEQREGILKDFLESNFYRILDHYKSNNVLDKLVKMYYLNLAFLKYIYTSISNCLLCTW